MMKRLGIGNDELQKNKNVIESFRRMRNGRKKWQLTN
jgi:hypothetical protein